MAEVEGQVKKLTKLAQEIRCELLSMCYKSGSSHIGSSFSITEILVALYFSLLKVSPETSRSKNRDRFILSKGHGCAAFYATLYRKGFISQEVLGGFAKNGGTLEQHPKRNLDWGIELSTGSLGHGLSVATGMALANKYDGLDSKVWVLLSDGETNEGSTWEAAMLAAQHKLDNLIAIIDYNKMQALGKTKEIINLEPFQDKWNSFGWKAEEIDGHSIQQLMDKFQKVPLSSGRPTCIIAHTIKGKGVCFMEDNLLWHYRCPDSEEYEKAICELN